jgi:hypothetical protein
MYIANIWMAVRLTQNSDMMLVIPQLLVHNPRDRLALDAVLQHPWIGMRLSYMHTFVSQMQKVDAHPG